MTVAGPHLERELAMVKVRGKGEHRMEALRLADAFRARVIDASTESFVFEITGSSDKIESFVALMIPLGLVEVSRTGIVAIARGPEGMERWRVTGITLKGGLARFAVASIYDRHDDNDSARAQSCSACSAAGEVADIGCGNGVLASRQLMGAEVDAIDISPAMLALANIRPATARSRSDPTGGPAQLCLPAEFYDLIVSEFALHHLPDFWKGWRWRGSCRRAEARREFYLRDIVFVSMPDGVERDVEQWADFSIKNHDFERESVVTHMRDEYSTFGWVIERMLTDVGFTLESVDYHAPLHGTYFLRKPKPDQQS
jgi:SAM-dependent methyltransferase